MRVCKSVLHLLNILNNKIGSSTCKPFSSSSLTKLSLCLDITVAKELQEREWSSRVGIRHGSTMTYKRISVNHIDPVDGFVNG